MNIANINKLIKFLQRLPAYHFNMDNWVKKTSHCGTTACIAGWATMIAPRKCKREFLGKNGFSYLVRLSANAPDVAKKWLDLTDDQADALFTPNYVSYDKVPLTNAIAYLENFRNTGKCDRRLLGKAFNDALAKHMPHADGVYSDSAG